MSQHNKKSRRGLILYPKFQLSLMVMNCLFLLGMAAFLGFTAKTSFTNMKNIGYQIHLYQNHPFFKLVDAESHHFYARLVIALIACMVMSSAFVLLASHKVVGPLVHLKKYFQNIASRERAPRLQLRFRRGDFFEDLPYSINNAISVLRSSPEEEEEEPLLDYKYKPY